MVFIGLRAVKSGTATKWVNAKIIHFNPHYIKMVNEAEMTLILDDGTSYRIDDESLQIFLAAMYGDSLKGDQLGDKDDY